MEAKIFCALTAIICLNSTDTLIDDSVTSREDNTIESIENDSSRNDIISRSNRWVSIAFRRLGVGTILGGIGSINCDGEGLGLLIPSLLSVKSSYTYWPNKHVGIVGKAILFGDMYCSFIDSSNLYVAILQLGVGIRWSYNGRGGRSNGTYYGGNVTVNLMGGSFADVSDKFRIGFNLGQFGVNISVIIFEWVNIKGFLGEVGTVFDIGSLNTNEVGENLLIIVIGNIKLSLGKNFYF